MTGKLKTNSSIWWTYLLHASDLGQCYSFTQKLIMQSFCEFENSKTMSLNSRITFWEREQHATLIYLDSCSEIWSLVKFKFSFDTQPLLRKCCRTHFGAALTGIAYGFLTCPSLQLDDASSSSSSTSGQEEGITLVRRYANPCKSLFLFTAFVLVLSSLLFFVEPPLNALASDNSV